MLAGPAYVQTFHVGSTDRNALNKEVPRMIGASILLYYKLQAILLKVLIEADEALLHRKSEERVFGNGSILHIFQ